MSIGIVNARVLSMTDRSTLTGDGAQAAPRCGPGLSDLGVFDRASVLVEGGRIASVIEGQPGEAAVRRACPARVIDAAGRVLLPGFVDAHTHACWAGHRLDEWDMRRAGAAYLDILNAGGGIMSTVRAVRAASLDDLAHGLLVRLNLMLRAGTTTVEVKSGYGLNTDNELKMLRAITAAAERFAGSVVPTALLGHAIDPEYGGGGAAGAEAFVEYTIRHTLPAVHGEFPNLAIDAYCERGAWTPDQCVRLFEAARTLGHPVRLHADQFNTLGVIQRVLALGGGRLGAAASVDHLEASTGEDLRRIAQSASTYGVILPLCGFHLDDRYANGRALIDAAPTSRVVIATNFNPGSAPSGSMPMAIATAVRRCGITPAEAIAAATVNAACLLGFRDRGVVAPGMRADLVLLRHRDERDLAYEFGLESAAVVISRGRIVEGTPVEPA